MRKFEKFAAFIFLLLLIGLIGFLTYVEVPDGSKQLISAIIGGLMLSAAQALPQLFGVEDDEKELLKSRVRKLETEYSVLKAAYDNLTTTLLKHHVIADNVADATAAATAGRVKDNANSGTGK